MDIYLIRHTSVANDNNICYGQSNIPLSDSFVEEAKAIKNYLSDDIQLISSPSIRCVRLSEFISQGVVYDNRLLELNFGLWEGMEWSSISKGEIELWAKDIIYRPCPNGECYNDLYKRATLFWDNIKTKTCYTKIAVITHSGVIRSILSYILNIPLENSFNISIDFAGISKISICNQFSRIEYINISYNFLKRL